MSYSEGQYCSGFTLASMKQVRVTTSYGDRDARPLKLATPLPSLQHLITFSDSSSVPIYTPGWREALGESKVSLTKEHLTLYTQTIVSTFSILYSIHFFWY